LTRAKSLPSLILKKTSGFLNAVGEVKFTGQVTPDVKNVRYHINLKRVIRRKLVLGIADGTMEADGEVIYKAKDLRVGLFIPQENETGGVA